MFQTLIQHCCVGEKPCVQSDIWLQVISKQICDLGQESSLVLCSFSGVCFSALQGADVIFFSPLAISIGRSKIVFDENTDLRQTC